MAKLTEYKITFEIFGQKRKCSIMARSIEEAKAIMLEHVKKQVIVPKAECTSPEYEQPNPAHGIDNPTDMLSKMFGFKNDTK